MATDAIGRLILIGAISTSGALPAQAIRATLPDPALEELVAQALARSPEVAASEAQAEAARARIAPSRTLPDPSVSVQYQNDGTGFTLGERDMTFLGATWRRAALPKECPHRSLIALSPSTSTIRKEIGSRNVAACSIARR